jgi:hypothetical protein
MGSFCFFRIYAANNLSAIFLHAFGPKGTLLSGDALDYNAVVLA